MLIIEFAQNLTSELIAVRYKENVNDEWSVIDMDIKTLNLFVQNFGIIAQGSELLDSPQTGSEFTVNYCGCLVKIKCRDSPCQNIRNDALHLLATEYAKTDLPRHIRSLGYSFK